MKILDPIILIACLITVLVCQGCLPSRISPGHSRVDAGDLRAAVTQSQDPASITTQTVTLESETLATNAPAVLRTKKTVTTTIGLAQKNSAQEIAAKLASVRWLQWVGILFLVFGGASLVYPPLRLIVGSVTTSVWCMAGGGAMIFLPLLIVGNELIILGAGAGVAGLWFFAHRHGQLRGEVNTLKK